MTVDEAIKYLKQLYPNGGHCWLDEQRLEAIGMAIAALEHEEPISEDLEEAARKYGDELDNILVTIGDNDDNTVGEYASQAFKAGAHWQKEKASSIVKQYANKGENNYHESVINEGKCSTCTCYWDGFADCANDIKRELED